MHAVVRENLEGFLADWRDDRGSETGSVTFLQRFGGALNLHPHFHTLIPDGLFVPVAGCEELEFVSLPPPNAEEVASLTERIARRITKRVRKLLEGEEERGSRLEETVLSMESSLLRSMRVPVADRAGLFDDADHESEASASRPSLCTKWGGFSLHAGRCVSAEDRESLERLCRYGLRAPFSQDGLWVSEGGRVIYELPRPWPHSGGVTHLTLDGREFLQRLSSLIPSPYMHLTRYHGVFSSRSKWRSRLTPLPVTAAVGVEGFAEWEPARVEEWEEFSSRPESDLPARFDTDEVAC